MAHRASNVLADASGEQDIDRPIVAARDFRSADGSEEVRERAPPRFIDVRAIKERAAPPMPSGRRTPAFASLVRIGRLPRSMR